MENLYLKYKNKNACNGCGACIYVCPKHCISMKEDEEGFLYPVIDEEKCIHCNKCKNVCSNYNVSKSELNDAYIAINKNEEERKMSASGGMFYILAKYTINKGGVVFGVKYDKNLNAVHDFAITLDKCQEFMGSKYVRSKNDGIYEKVLQLLLEDKYVLFTGTPCQISGLKTFLNKDYEKLITCEIICHANPSPKVFNEYKKELELKNNAKIKNIAFRSKKNGWSNSTPIIEFENGEEIEDKTFYTAFIAELFNRPSCHTCPFVGENRQADFTIGDLWGIQEIEPEMNDNKGVSLLLINSRKANNIFNQINENMKYKKIDKKIALSYNHNTCVPPNKNRRKFFNKLSKNDGNLIKYMKKYSHRSFIQRVKGKLNKIIKK